MMILILSLLSGLLDYLIVYYITGNKIVAIAIAVLGFVAALIVLCSMKVSGKNSK